VVRGSSRGLENKLRRLIGMGWHPKRLDRNVRELVIAHRREHSRKPEEIYDRIERLVPGPYLELFSR